jgi:hypothetical protein
VTFTQVSDPKIVRYSNVIEIGVEDADNNIQYFKVLFGGSESGTYTPRVRSKNYGRFDTRGVTLKTEGIVIDFNPKQGSVNGGTLITIDGINFSNEPTDNPVRIGHTDCMVETSSTT